MAAEPVCTKIISKPSNGDFFNFKWSRADGDFYHSVMRLPTAKYIGNGIVAVSVAQFESVELFSIDNDFRFTELAVQTIAEQKRDPIYLLKQLSKLRIDDSDTDGSAGSVVVDQVFLVPKSKSSVMKRAWVIAREAVAKFGGKVKEFFSQSLTLAWSEYHTGV